MWSGYNVKNTFKIRTFFVNVFFQNFKSRIITQQICQNFYTLITEEPVAFLDIRAHRWEIYSDISKKHSSFIFKDFECPEDYSRASEILKHTQCNLKSPVLYCLLILQKTVLYIS